MNRTIPIILISCLGMTGCTLIKTKAVEPKLVGNPLGTAQELIKEDRLGEAVIVLKEAYAQGWDSDAYRKALKQAQLKQQQQEQELKDWLLVQKTHALKKSLPLQTRLTRTIPDEPGYQAELERIQSELKQNQKRLSQCGWHHKSENPDLARQCISLALSLHPDKQDHRLLDRLTENKEKIQEKETQRQQAALKQEKKERIEKHLKLGQKLFQENRLKDARRHLRMVLEEEPDNPRAKQLLSKLQIRLEGYVNNLLRAGDRLYRDGEIEGAKATWQAALNMDPSDSRAKEKIERAQRVLENLETLRKSQ